MTFTFIVEGARVAISLCIRSEIPGYKVVPPDYENLANLQGVVSRKNVTYHHNITI